MYLTGSCGEIGRRCSKWTETIQRALRSFSTFVAWMHVGCRRVNFSLTCFGTARENWAILTPLFSRMRTREKSFLRTRNMAVNWWQGDGGTFLDARMFLCLLKNYSKLLIKLQSRARLHTFSTHIFISIMGRSLFPRPFATLFQQFYTHTKRQVLSDLAPTWTSNRNIHLQLKNICNQVCSVNILLTRTNRWQYCTKSHWRHTCTCYFSTSSSFFVFLFFFWLLLLYTRYCFRSQPVRKIGMDKKTLITIK